MKMETKEEGEVGNLSPEIVGEIGQMAIDESTPNGFIRVTKEESQPIILTEKVRPLSRGNRIWKWLERQGILMWVEIAGIICLFVFLPLLYACIILGVYYMVKSLIYLYMNPGMLYALESQAELLQQKNPKKKINPTLDKFLRTIFSPIYWFVDNAKKRFEEEEENGTR